MEQALTPGTAVVTSDDHTIGTIVGVRDDCALVQTGHVFHSVHAIPTSFLHEVDGKLRATVAKEIVASSPKVSEDDWDGQIVLLHYGLVLEPEPVEATETETL